MRANCVICSDLLDGDNPNVTTPCGHVFHQTCVLQWFEYNKTCPACRKSATANKLITIYLTVNEPEKGEEKCSNVLENEICNLKSTIRTKDQRIRQLEERASEIQCFVVKAEGERDDFQRQLMDSMGQVAALKMQLRQALKENTLSKKYVAENHRLESQLVLLKNVEAIINNSESDINDILSNYGDDPTNLSHMATYLSMMKRQLQMSTEEKCSLQRSNREFRKKIGLLNSEMNDARRQIEGQKLEIKQLTENLDRLEETGKRKYIPPNATAKRPLNDSFGTPMTLDTTLQENTPTPLKRPKINMVNALVTKLNAKQRDGQDSALLDVGKRILNNKSRAGVHGGDDEEDTTSCIRQGYDGMGGHSKHITRSTPVLKHKLGRKISFKK